MNSYRATRRLLSVVVALVLLVSSVAVVAAQGGPQNSGGGSSGTRGVRAPTSANNGPVSATEGTGGAAGGTDVALPCVTFCHPANGTYEPAIAVNPLNSNNIATTSLFELRVSTNNGGTFSAATAATFPATHTPCGDSSVAFDSQGHLFWTYLGCVSGTSRADIFIAQVNPTTGAILAGYPINVTASPGVNLPAASGSSHDKQWLAADHFPGSASPFRDRLYIVWTDLTTGSVVRTTSSADQGLNWSAPVTLSAATGEGFVWPSHNAVAANGDVYVAYHSQPGFTNNEPNGTSGQIFVLRSSDGGVTYPQKTTAYAAGNADITFNVQTDTRILNGSASWTQGSAQPWVLPDPLNPNNVYVVAADDPTNTNNGAGFDDMDIFIVRSTDQGMHWNAPVRVDQGPVGTTQFFPTAAIDDKSQCLAVAWYDTRAGVTNTGGNFLLDVRVRNSCDGGVNFGPEVQVNDARFDPDVNAIQRFAGPPPTLRIGEYIGVTIVNGIVTHTVWTGNSATNRQQIMYDNTVAAGAVDVYFIVDLSGSFTDDLPNFQTQAPNIISTLRAGNANTRFGIGKFEDYPIDPFGNPAAGDKAYERLVDLTFDTGPVLSTIAGLFTRDGADLPQSQLAALFQAATGAGQDLSGAGFPGASIPAGQQANFRAGATKIFLLWTDAAFHRPGDPGTIPYPGPSFTDVANAVLALDPGKVIGISSGTDGLADLQQIAAATNTFAPPGGVDCNNDGVIDIAGGEPLVCVIGPSGEGVSAAILASVEAVAVPFKVNIDIKPGSSPTSPIRLSSPGKIPVAILSTPIFDAPSRVDKTSLTFGRTGYEKSFASCSTNAVDVNGDGLLDQVCNFKTQSTGFQIDDTEGILRGRTVDGFAIEGRDAIKIVP